MNRTPSPRRRPERQSAPAPNPGTMTGFVLEIPETGDVVLHFARPDPKAGAQVTALCGASGRASFDYGKPSEGEQWRRKALCKGCLR